MMVSERHYFINVNNITSMAWRRHQWWQCIKTW